MTREQQLAIYKDRLATLKNRDDKNVKCPGVVRKIMRNIRNLENSR